MGARIGVDIGGTFTDVVLLREGGVAAVGKTLTTPADPSQGVLTAVREVLARAGIGPGDVSEIVHGTTLVANALIERKGAKTGLVTTKGFRDSLAMRREHRYDIYDLDIRLPEPLVPRSRRWEVSERVLADGTVVTSPDPGEIRLLAERARREGVESVAVCFLHSYRFPAHEREAERILIEELGDVPVTASHAVTPELGEYVRTSTAVANAYVRPLVDRYLSRLEAEIRALGVAAPIRLVLSTGALSSIEVGRRFPIRLSESGPAAGAVSAAFFGRLAGEENLLAFDMGGTTAKACLIEAGRTLLAAEHEVARVHRFAKESGLPIRVPVVDLIEIGAGGGSIAHVDRFGLPRVGPESAGADPGPACYARGGDQPTVTDADLLLGYLDAGYFLGGELRLDLDAAAAAMGRLGERLGLSAEGAAAAVHQVVDENMAGAARIHAIERGRDVRDFTLVATGGAGPVHAWSVARRLGLKRILYPPGAGVASALGMLTSAPAFDFARSLPSPLADVPWREVRDAVAEMVREGRRQLGEAAKVEVSADVRYRGQGATVTVPLGAGIGPRPALDLTRAFDRAYVRLYGRRLPEVELEVLTWRVRVAGAIPAVRIAAGPGTRAALKGKRRIWSTEAGRFVEASLWDRYQLAAGQALEGPAVVEERESSVVLGPGARAVVDAHGILRVDVT